MEQARQVVQSNPSRAVLVLIIAGLCALGCLELRNKILVGSIMRPWVVYVEDQTSDQLVRDYKEYIEEQDRKKRR